MVLESKKTARKPFRRVQSNLHLRKICAVCVTQGQKKQHLRCVRELLEMQNRVISLKEKKVTKLGCKYLSHRDWLIASSGNEKYDQEVRKEMFVIFFNLSVSVVQVSCTSLFIGHIYRRITVLECEIIQTKDSQISRIHDNTLSYGSEAVNALSE